MRKKSKKATKPESETAIVKSGFTLPAYTQYDPILLPAIQNLTAMGYRLGDIGMILGYMGPEVNRWISDLKRNHPDVKEAIETGKKLSRAFLIAQMYKAAVGYEFDEIETKYEWRVDPETGRKRKIKMKEKVFKHLKHPSTSLATFLAVNKLQDEFEEKDDKGDPLGKQLSADKLRELAGKLMELADSRKVIESVKTKESE